MDRFIFKITLIALIFISNEISWSLDLTDQDRQQKDNFVHKGKSDRALEELCQKKGDLDQLPDACKGRQLKTWGISPTMVQSVSKMYAMFLAMPLNMSGNTGNTGNTGKGLRGGRRRRRWHGRRVAARRSSTEERPGPLSEAACKEEEEEEER